MQHTLDDIFFGKTRFFERGSYHLPEYSKLMRTLADLELQLDSLLSPKAAQLFEQYQKADNDMLFITKSEAFKEGFSLAVRLIFEANEIYHHIRWE